ncbi:hypothetical protein Tco_0977454 [Tanacetum coccineum]|uniref:Reverse transcriptase domain-containing protein n=1 Tax=Tanacetum coccineum TaxID=301880 RepID=A0ABQ5EL94_9ASTR
MDTSEKLMPNDGHDVSQLEYSRVIGCLMYAMTCTRPDIAFAVDKLSRYTSNSGTQYWQAIQRVLKYLKKTMNYRLTYTGYPLVLKGYTDASWISNTEENSSTSGWVFLLGGGAISWASKKQTCITGSTMESEFVALAAAGKEAEWLKNLLLEIPLWVKPLAPISIRYDSAATLFVRSQQNLADHLTKGLARDLGIKSVEGMGLKLGHLTMKWLKALRSLMDVQLSSLTEWYLYQSEGLSFCTPLESSMLKVLPSGIYPISGKYPLSCSNVIAFACVILSLLLEDNLCAYDCYVNIMWYDYSCMHRGAYDLGVATPRALVYAGLMTSGDARSWYMIREDAKFLQTYELTNIIVDLFEYHFQVKLMISKIMPPRMTTQSAGRATAAPRGGRTGGRTGRRGGRTRGQSGDQGSDRIDGQGGQIGGQGSEVIDGVDGVLDFSTIIAQQLQNLLPTIEFLACNPKESDGKGGAIVCTCWIEKMESVQDMCGCRDNQKVKYTAGSFVCKALTWWNSQIHTRSQEVAVGMSWEDFKTLTREEFCPSNEMQKF